MLERMQIDNNQRIRMIRIWLTILGTIIILLTMFAAGAVKMNQVEENKEDIEVIEVKQEEQKELLIRIDENVKGIKEDIVELKDR